MKALFFETRQDEKALIGQYASESDLSANLSDEILSMENVSLTAGYDAISTLGQSKLNRELLTALSDNGVKYITTRTVGFDHIDLQAAKELGIKVCRAEYPADGVAEFAVMQMLLVLRCYKPMLWRLNVNDYSLAGMMGRELHSMTVGILGGGRIGKRVAKILHGFGAKILVSSLEHDDELALIAEYCDNERIYAESDMITLHLPLLPETRYMINAETIAQMKDGVILINTARGELMNIEEVTRGIETEKIGALAMDVFENEQGIYHADRRLDILQNKDMVYLRQFPNVVMTPHMAFYTAENVRSMVYCGVNCLVQMEKGEKTHLRVV